TPFTQSSHRALCRLAGGELADRQSVQAAAQSGTMQNCCEGDILLLLDSSGSVTNYEFSVFLRFASDLLRPFSLGRGNVRVALLQVGTTPHTEFSLDVHTKQESLQEALRGVRQLQGDTNTPTALQEAKRLLTNTEQDVPKVLLWLTDGVESGDMDELMSELKAHGVSVLIVYTIHGNHQVMQRAVSPPVESHLYSMDLSSIDIITDDLREAIIQRLSVTHLTSHSAVLQWRPALNADSGNYNLWYSSVGKPVIKDFLSGGSSKAELTILQPETTYTAVLQPQSSQRPLSPLSVTFTTLPDVLGPAEISLSDCGPYQVRISWGPLQPLWVQRYTVEFGPIPFGEVHTVALDNQRSSTLLTGLQPGTQYLVTVNALHVDGTERALSVRACTQEATVPPHQQKPVEVAWPSLLDASWMPFGEVFQACSIRRRPLGRCGTHQGALYLSIGFLPAELEGFSVEEGISVLPSQPNVR
uniref:von Willebrand factor A domain-containing protein 1 n=1 Tax=Oryzias latipes TaxID=8090 RepID=A0A3P9M0A5_ORYLA